MISQPSVLDPFISALFVSRAFSSSHSTVNFLTWLRGAEAGTRPCRSGRLVGSGRWGRDCLLLLLPRCCRSSLLRRSLLRCCLPSRRGSLSTWFAVSEQVEWVEAVASLLQCQFYMNMDTIVRYVLFLPPDPEDGGDAAEVGGLDGEPPDSEVVFVRCDFEPPVLIGIGMVSSRSFPASPPAGSGPIRYCLMRVHSPAPTPPTTELA